MRRKKRKKINLSSIGMMLLFILVCIFVALLLTGWSCEKKESNVKSGNGYLSGTDSKTSYSENEKSYNNGKIYSAKLKQKAKDIYRKNKESLVLVNKKQKISKDYNAQLISICKGRLEASERLYEDLKEMLEAGDIAGYSFFIASAYRNAERQKQLLEHDVETFMNQGLNYNEALATAMKHVMPAGYSEHETGLALDICTSDNLKLDVSQEKMAGNQWMRKNCRKYGFILRYPENKEEITGISYEPWHFRYVGKEAAQFMEENALTLEEFYEMLQ